MSTATWRARPPVPGAAALWGVAVAVPTLLVLVLGWSYRWTTEDGFIYFRIVRQVLEGNGPVFNDGQRVEAFTSPLWLFVITLGDVLLPLRLEWVAALLGLALTAAGVVLAMLGARRLWGRTERTSFAPFGVLVVAALLPFWMYATSGLETGLTFGWLGLALFLLARWADGGEITVPQAVVLGLGWLVRPELAVVSGLVLLLLLVAQGRHAALRARLTLVAAMVAVPVAYQLFRMGYFGALTANTAIAKEGSELQFSRGWRYLLDLVMPYWLWLPAIGVVVGGYLPFALRNRRRRRALGVLAVFVAGGLVCGAYTVAIGGDYLHARLLLPPLFALLAPVAVVPLRREHLAALIVLPWALVCGFALRPVEDDAVFTWTARGFDVPPDRGEVSLDDFGWVPIEDASWYTGPGLYLQAPGFAPALHRVDLPLRDDLPDTTAAVITIGRSGYAVGTDVDVVDVLGLADPLGGRLEGMEGRYAVAGHEKPLPVSWLVARLTSPGAPVTPLPLWTQRSQFLIPPTTGPAFQEQVAWARATLGCSGLYHALRATEAPLDVRLFASNVFRASEYTRLRVPPDPREAYRELCGEGTPPEVLELTEPRA